MEPNHCCERSHGADAVRRWLIAVMLIVVASAACQRAETVGIESDDEALRRVYATWINQLGLERDEPQVWRSRLEEACSQGVWDRTVAVALAERYVKEDAHLGGTADDSAPSPSKEAAADALWLMAVEVCRDRFPAGAVEEGPPFSTSARSGGR